MDRGENKAEEMNRDNKSADKEKLKTETPKGIQEEKAGRMKDRVAKEANSKKLEAHQPPPVNAPTRPSDRDHGRRFKGPDLDASPETI